MTIAALRALRNDEPAASSTFDADDRQALQTTLATARASMLVVHECLQAQEDQALTYPDGGWHRWGPAIGRVVKQLSDVRDLLIEKDGAPVADWSEALFLAEAFDGAAWWAQQHPAGGSLDFHDAQLFARELVAAIDDLAAACDAEGVMPTSAVH